VLRKHFDKVERVFPYVVTLGSGVEALEKASGDAVEKYYLDLIGNAAVVKAREHLKDTLGKRYGLEGLSYLGPGQLKGLASRRAETLVFAAGRTFESAVGVGLSEEPAHDPPQVALRHLFPYRNPVHGLSTCARENCPSRKARYDEKLAKEYYNA